MGLTLLGAALGKPDERKVPPRTPPQRLETLQRFFKEYIQTNVAENRPDRAANQEAAVDRIYEPLDEIFHALKPDGSGLRRCSFFDPNVPNGGPRPVSGTNTRAAEDWVAQLLCEFDGFTGPQCDTKRRRRSADNFDPFDDYEAQLENGERATASVRLSPDVALALRQVNTRQKYLFRCKMAIFNILFRSELVSKNGFFDTSQNVPVNVNMVFIPSV